MSVFNSERFIVWFLVCFTSHSAIFKQYCEFIPNIDHLPSTHVMAARSSFVHFTQYICTVFNLFSIGGSPAYDKFMLKFELNSAQQA